MNIIEVRTKKEESLLQSFTEAVKDNKIINELLAKVIVLMKKTNCKGKDAMKATLFVLDKVHIGSVNAGIVNNAKVDLSWEYIVPKDQYGDFKLMFHSDIKPSNIADEIIEFIGKNDELETLEMFLESLLAMYIAKSACEYLGIPVVDDDYQEEKPKTLDEIVKELSGEDTVKVEPCTLPDDDEEEDEDWGCPCCCGPKCCEEDDEESGDMEISDNYDHTIEEDDGDLVINIDLASFANENGENSELNEDEEEVIASFDILDETNFSFYREGNMLTIRISEVEEAD